MVVATMNKARGHRAYEEYPEGDVHKHKPTSRIRPIIEASDNEDR